MSYKIVTNYYLKVVQDCAFCMVLLSIDFKSRLQESKDPRA